MTFTYKFASDLIMHPEKKSISIRSLKDLERFQEEVAGGDELIIDFKSKTILVYNDYIE